MRYCMIIRKFSPAMQHYGRKKKKKGGERESEKNRAVCLLRHIGEFRAGELCIWVSSVLKENFRAVFSAHFQTWLSKMPNLKGTNIKKK